MHCHHHLQHPKHHYHCRRPRFSPVLPFFSVVLSFKLIHPFGFLVSPDSQGSVIADLLVQFKNDVSESEISELTDKITEDGKLGPLGVDDFSVGPTTQRKYCSQ